MNYKEAQVIRQEYPEFLSDNDIQAIVERWPVKHGHDRGMMGFGCYFDAFDKYNKTEFKLYVMYELKCLKSFIVNKEYLDKTESETHALLKMVGCVVWANLKHIVESNYESRFQLEKFLEAEILTFLNEIKNHAILDGILSVLEIEISVTSKYYPGQKFRNPIHEKVYIKIKNILTP
jgi:hypothetical protein